VPLCCAVLFVLTYVSLLLGHGGIPHVLPLPFSGATRKLVIKATISHKQSEVSIDVQLHVDGGCEAFELVLLPDDVAALGILPTGESGQEIQPDGSLITMAEYERVFVELEHLDGTTESASLFPFVQTGTEPAATITVHDVPAETHVTRLLGYGGLTRFGLKQDFVGHKLVHYLKRA
jgi:hypothetical protein